MRHVTNFALAEEYCGHAGALRADCFSDKQLLQEGKVDMGD